MADPMTDFSYPSVQGGNNVGGSPQSVPPQGGTGVSKVPASAGNVSAPSPSAAPGMAPSGGTSVSPVPTGGLAATPGVSPTSPAAASGGSLPSLPSTPAPSDPVVTGQSKDSDVEAKPTGTPIVAASSSVPPAPASSVVVPSPGSSTSGPTKSKPGDKDKPKDDGVELASLAKKLSSWKDDFVSKDEPGGNKGPAKSVPVSSLSKQGEKLKSDLNMPGSKVGVSSTVPPVVPQPDLKKKGGKGSEIKVSPQLKSVPEPSSGLEPKTVSKPEVRPDQKDQKPVLPPLPERKDKKEMSGAGSSGSGPATVVPATSVSATSTPVISAVSKPAVSQSATASLQQSTPAPSTPSVTMPPTPVSSGKFSKTIVQLLDIVVEKDASDLHVTVGYPVLIRIDGKLEPLGSEIITEETAADLILPVLPENKKELLEVNREVDLAYAHKDKGRFRINAYYERGRMAAAFRLIPSKIRTIEELKLPGSYHQLTKIPQGFVLVTGPTGHGKSTTLAAILNEINMTYPKHIITIEDPIEYIYPPGKALVDQREMHEDTHSWEIALRSALRQDPDVILVGEMRDFETIAAAITLAETGHLVFATLHTNNASQTIDRIIDVFPEHQQAQVRTQLANIIEAVISQRLVPLTGGGRRAVSEIMLATPAIRNLVREGKTYQIDNVISTSLDLGMKSLEQSLVDLVREGVITTEVAENNAVHPEEVVRLLK